MKMIGHFELVTKVEEALKELRELCQTVKVASYTQKILGASKQVPWYNY